MERIEEILYWQPDEIIHRYVFHLKMVDGVWHIKKVVFTEEDFNRCILNYKEYFVVPTIVEDIESLDLTSLRWRTWIDKQDLKWLAELVKEDKELLSELISG